MSAIDSIAWPDVKPRSRIECWNDWPDDVRELLRDWNRKRGLRFDGRCVVDRPWPVFKCSRCDLFHKAPRYGVAVLHGDDVCDPCLVELARAAQRHQRNRR